MRSAARATLVGVLLLVLPVVGCGAESNDDAGGGGGPGSGSVTTGAGGADADWGEQPIWTRAIGSEVQFATVDGQGNLIVGAYGEPSSLSSDEAIPTENYERRFIGKLRASDGTIEWTRAIDDLGLSGVVHGVMAASPSGKIAYRRWGSTGVPDIVELSADGELLGSTRQEPPLSWGLLMAYDSADSLWVDGTPGARLSNGEVTASLDPAELGLASFDAGGAIHRFGSAFDETQALVVRALALDGTTQLWEASTSQAGDCASCGVSISGRTLADGAVAVRYQVHDSQGASPASIARDWGCGPSPIALVALSPDGTCRWSVDLDFAPLAPVQLNASGNDVLLQRGGLRAIDGATGEERRRWPDVHDLHLVAATMHHHAAYVLRFNSVNGKNAVEVIRLR